MLRLLYFLILLTMAVQGAQAQHAVTGQPSWSPDGQHIIYTSNESGTQQIYTVRADGTSPKRLTDTTSNETNPSFSPDGKTILFTSDRDGNVEIYLMNADGSEQQRLTHTPENEAMPSFSPNGSKIIFCYNADDQKEIYQMYADGTSLTRLSTGTHQEIYPKYAPDGGRLVVTARIKGEPHFQIMTMLPDGTNRKDLTQRPTPHYNASWSPDGSHIVFVSMQGRDITTAAVHIMDADGSNLRILPHADGGSFQPRWSPVGKQIVFRKGWVDDHVGLFIVDIDGSGLTQITNLPTETG